jgi:hypothetical protein
LPTSEFKVHAGNVNMHPGQIAGEVLQQSGSGDRACRSPAAVLDIGNR